MTSGGKGFGVDNLQGDFDLEEIQADDALLDRLAARESGSDDGLEALLGAWAREIDEDAVEMAGRPPRWSTDHMPKLRSLRLHRAAALAGAVVVTMSGGMAAVALSGQEGTLAGPVVFVQEAKEAFGRILPQQPSTVATTDSTVPTGQEAIPPAGVAVVSGSGATEVAPGSAPLKPSSGLPTPTDPAESVDVVSGTVSATGADQVASGVVIGPTTSNPAQVPSASAGSSTAGGSTPAASSNPATVKPSTGTSGPATSTPTSTKSPEPTAAETATSPAPPPDVKDEAPVTTPGGVHVDPEGPHSPSLSPSTGASESAAEPTKEPVKDHTGPADGFSSLPADGRVGSAAGTASPGASTVGE